MNNTKYASVSGLALLAGVVSVSAQDTAPLYKIGSLDVRPHAAYSLVYDDNIFLENKDKSTNQKGNAGRDHDWISTITPGLRLNAGDAVTRQSAFFDANYEAAIIRFANYTGSDAVDHNANLALGGKFNRLSLNVSQSLASYSDADQHNLAANGRVKRKLWDTKAGAAYEVSEKTTAGLDFVQTINDYPAPFVNSTERSGNLWMDYQVLPKVKMGASAGGGYLQVDNTATFVNPNSVYENGQLRLEWQMTEKTTVKASGGIENRHYQGQGTDKLSAIFSIGADWRATEATTFSLSAKRGSKPSNANGNTINEETSVTLGVKHGLMDGLSVKFDGGYQVSQYSATTLTSIAAGSIRDDNYYFLKPGLSYRFAERAQATAFYQYRRNNSNLPANGNDFYGNQIGMEISYRF